jgi:hypothetical protein
MKKTATFLLTALLSITGIAQTAHIFYVQDFNNQGYDPLETITVEVGDVVRFLNGTGGTYNFEIADQNNQPNFEEPGVPSGQLIYELTIDANYPNYNEITVSEYTFNPSFIKTVEILRSTAGVEEVEAQLSILPNPVQDVLSISSEANVQEINIVSAVGKLVYSGSTTNNIDVSMLPSGVYIVNCTLENNQIVTKKFIKN